MATSKLQRLFGNMLDQRLPEYRIRENYRPDWLVSSDKTFLELDFYIEELNIAFEVQGEQHYKFVPFFHKSEEDFKKRRRHDREKRNLCEGRRIKLIEIMTEFDAEIAVKNIEETTKKNQPKYSYYYEELIIKEKKKKEIERIRKKCAPKRIDNSESVRRERIEKCVNNLKLFESGLLVASDGKVMKWKQVIESDGYETSAEQF